MSIIKKYFEKCRECEVLKAEIINLKKLLKETLAEHETGHSPCSCIEIKDVVK
jgi:hypothetical protein